MFYKLLLIHFLRRLTENRLFTTHWNKCQEYRQLSSSQPHKKGLLIYSKSSYYNGKIMQRKIFHSKLFSKKLIMWQKKL